MNYLTLNSNSGDVVCCCHIWPGYTPANMSNIPIAYHLVLSDTQFQLTITPGAQALGSAATLSQLETHCLGGLPKILPFPVHPATAIQMMSHHEIIYIKRNSIDSILDTVNVGKAWSRCNNGGSTNVNVFFNILLNSLWSIIFVSYVWIFQLCQIF